MPGITDGFRILLAEVLFGTGDAADLGSILASPWFQFHEGPPGPDGTANPALDTRRVQIPMSAPATDAGSHLFQIKSTALAEITNWIAPTQDIEQVLTDFTCWTTDHGGTNETCIGRGPLGGLPWHGCSANATNDVLTSRDHGLTAGNLVEVMAMPMQDPTLPDFGARPDTRYIVDTTGLSGPDFKLKGEDGTPIVLGVDMSVMIVRARRHTIDMGGRLQVPVGMIALPFI